MRDGIANQNAMDTKLSDKQQRFVDEYLIDLNATQAAIRAGYSETSARKIASENMTKPDIQEAIYEARRLWSERTMITQDSVLKDIEAIKQDSMQIVIDRDGNRVMLDRTAALRACDLQGKHLGMFVQRLEVTGKDGAPMVDLSGMSSQLLHELMSLHVNTAAVHTQSS